MARILTAIAASVAKSVVKPITSIAHAMQKLSVGPPLCNWAIASGAMKSDG